MIRKVALGGALLLLVGCDRSSRDLMPLAVGRVWTYNVRTPFFVDVQSVRVKRIVSTAGVRGFQLESPLGDTRLAWKGPTLLMERFGQGRLSPAIPIALEGVGTAKEPKVYDWSGTLEIDGKLQKATGHVSQHGDNVSVKGRKVSVVQSDLTLNAPGKQIELVTSFQPGVGIVKQEQRTNGKFDASLEIQEG